MVVFEVISEEIDQSQLDCGNDNDAIDYHQSWLYSSKEKAFEKACQEFNQVVSPNSLLSNMLDYWTWIRYKENGVKVLVRVLRREVF